MRSYSLIAVLMFAALQQISFASAVSADPTCILTATPQPAHVDEVMTLTLTAIGNVQSGFVDLNRVNVPIGTLTETPAAIGRYTAIGMILSDEREFFCNIQYDVAVAELATLTGDVVSAATGLPLAGVTIGNAVAGTAATSDALGRFTFNNVALGPFTLTASLTGYTTETHSDTAVSGTNPPIHFVLNPVLPEGQLRAVLTWGAEPTDLDTHLFTKWDAGSAFHLFYQALTGLNTKLDVDDVSSYGPETATILDATPGHYSYAVNDYSDRSGPGKISTANAVVKVYQGGNLINEFQPTNSGTEVSWHVFDAEISATGDVTITPVNTYSNINLDTQTALTF